MGVVHKLKPEIIDYIIGLKKSNSDISCRSTTALVLEKFNKKISKSSINTIWKQADLSVGVGRRSKIKADLLPVYSSGAAILQAVDCLINGKSLLAELLVFKLQLPQPEADAIINEYLFSSFLKKKPASLLKHIEPKKLQDRILLNDAVGIINSLADDIRCIRFDSHEERSFFVDGQFHTVWATSKIPDVFCMTAKAVEERIGNHAQGDPFVLFLAPGYEAPTEEFINFILGFGTHAKSISKFTLFKENLYELKTLPFNDSKKREYIFGVWPWQFSAMRTEEIKSDFKEVYFEDLKKTFYIAEAEIVLKQPKLGLEIKFRSCALKVKNDGRVKIFILSNYGPKDISLEALAHAYLRYWPNLEESFQDFSRKVEAFAYNPDSLSQLASKKKEACLGLAQPKDLGNIINAYLCLLDLFIKKYLLPAGFTKDKNISFTSEYFYHLAAQIDKDKENYFLTFLVDEGYPYLNELEYLCNRLNEKTVIFEGSRLWFGARINQPKE